MAANAIRVAEQYLQAAIIPEPGDDEKDLNYQVDLMNRLITKGEARRLGRTSDIRLQRMGYTGDRVWAKVLGTTGDYDTAITIRPHPGHHCTCADWVQNGKRVGPCKHVLKLGEEWLDALVRKLESL